jgi:hypothetical protein
MFGLGAFLLSVTYCAAESALPSDNPASSLGEDWTEKLAWSNVTDITKVPGKDLSERLATAQKDLSAKGGGVVYFPAGEYRFMETIRLKSGIILRGAAPSIETDPRKDGYTLGSRFEFPKYDFKATGEGTPTTSAFKGIELEEPATASNCGLVHLAINRGHVLFTQAEDGACGRNRLVLGCMLRNSAFADPAVPDTKIGQQLWQRYTWRFGAAIDVKSAENLLIARNRIEKSGEDNFTMNGFVLLGAKKQPQTVDGVVFDYDNRPGIYANHASLGGPGGQGPDGTPETHPQGFRKGIVIAENYIYSTGRCAIGFSGDGVLCNGNTIRFPKDIWRPTATGRDLTSGSSTNDTRAMEVRGWRWTVSDNDYEVYRNWAFDRKYPINDGEGIMHEDHANSTVKDSVLRNNRGNTYLSIYKTAGIDGLVVEGNDIRLNDGKQTIAGGAAIFVSANRTFDAFPCRNVTIQNNTVSGGGILISGAPAQGNVVKANKAAGATPLKIQNQAGAKLEANDGFTVDETPWQPARKR